MRSIEINRSLSNLSLPQLKVIMLSVEDSKDERSESPNEVKNVIISFLFMLKARSCCALYQGLNLTRESS